jgi:RNA-directed DNA polymerase
VFAGRGLDDRGIWKDIALQVCSEVKIRRHKKVKMDANPFDPCWDAYFENRHRDRLLAKHQEQSQHARLLKRQGGCAHIADSP